MAKNPEDFRQRRYVKEKIFQLIIRILIQNGEIRAADLKDEVGMELNTAFRYIKAFESETGKIKHEVRYKRYHFWVMNIEAKNEQS